MGGLWDWFDEPRASRLLHGNIKVTPDMAIIDTPGDNVRMTDSGREVLSREGCTMVAVREDGEWLWAAIRGARVTA